MRSHEAESEVKFHDSATAWDIVQLTYSWLVAFTQHIVTNNNQNTSHASEPHELNTDWSTTSYSF